MEMKIGRGGAGRAGAGWAGRGAFLPAGEIFVYFPDEAKAAEVPPGPPDQHQVQGEAVVVARHHGEQRAVRAAAAVGQSVTLLLCPPPIHPPRFCPVCEMRKTARTNKLRNSGKLSDQLFC